MTNKLIGRDFIPPDMEAKVRGEARYTEDIHVDGMLHCKLLTSPVPHERAFASCLRRSAGVSGELWNRSR